MKPFLFSLNPPDFREGLPKSTWGVPPLSFFPGLITWNSAGIVNPHILTSTSSAIPTTDTTLASALVRISSVFLSGPSPKNLGCNGSGFAVSGGAWVDADSFIKTEWRAVGWRSNGAKNVTCPLGAAAFVVVFESLIPRRRCHRVQPSLEYRVQDSSRSP
ncbi:hypothetical protein PIB30_069382 [Stylosanthes scabra]|uniref:Uncharacterized protein n=1 Tax=Stylosanthes scabra TaxID=79078 RepID=A0ABU6XP23_9FABA|nr:hypothetical protein [Stylosanthes scabra]